METPLSRDLARLDRLAFRRTEKSGNLLKDIHRCIDTIKPPNSPAHLLTIRDWLLVPFTLWPIDFCSLGEHIVRLHDKGERCPADIQYALSRIRVIPNEVEQDSVARYERMVEGGRYEHWLKPKALKKFSGEIRKLKRNPEFKREWQELKRLFQVVEPDLGKNLFRRSMVQERNFRIGWEFKPDVAKCRFQLAFDAFCHKWKLYGMEGEKPLLLKLSVNLTAHGTMIVLPAFWSFDHQRDLKWDSIMDLHKTRGVQRQGPKLSPSRFVTEDFCRRAVRFWMASHRMGLRGDKRLQWTIAKLKRDPRTDSGTLRRWVRKGKKLLPPKLNRIPKMIE